MLTPLRSAVAIALLAGVTPAHAANVVSSNFDQIAAVSALGGTAFQLGGDAPGTQLFTAGDFVGSVSSQTGVQIALPGWDFIDSTGPLNDVGPTEPANIAVLLTGVPTDMTYTQPGAGGPDGTIGDGSIQFSNGDSISVFWNSTQTGLPGIGADMLIATNTAGGGGTNFFFRLGGVDVDSLLGFVIPGALGGSGTGGVFINVTAPFDEIFIVGLGGSVEIDAIGTIPAPAATALLAPLGLLAWRRRRRPFDADALRPTPLDFRA
jgi:hypothetical protein